jgi:hypothetical protein
MSGATLLVICIVVAVAVVAIVWTAMQRRRHESLRRRFGPEYDRTVKAVGTTGRADAVLEERTKRVAEYHLRPLSAEERARFDEQWRRVQARFVDDPAGAVTDGDMLVNEVMTARGYPMHDIDRRLEDLTVEHGPVVDHYRAARDIAARHTRHEASTEDLRQALVHYRALFADLLGPNDVRRTA